jgi:hypothetical protein
MLGSSCDEALRLAQDERLQRGHRPVIEPIRARPT